MVEKDTKNTLSNKMALIHKRRQCTVQGGGKNAHKERRTEGYFPKYQSPAVINKGQTRQAASFQRPSLSFFTLIAKISIGLVPSLHLATNRNNQISCGKREKSFPTTLMMIIFMTPRKQSVL